MLGMYAENSISACISAYFCLLLFVTGKAFHTTTENLCCASAKVVFFSGAETLRSIVKCSAQIPGEYSHTFAVVQS